MLVLEACGKRGSSLWTTKRTNTFLDRAEPSSRARRTNFRASSCMARGEKKTNTRREKIKLELTVKSKHKGQTDYLIWKLETCTSCFLWEMEKNLPGPRNWHPRARTAAHRLEESCCGFWCCKMSSVTVRSPRERAALMALTRPSSSTSWQWTRVTSFLCIGRLNMLWAVLLRPTPGERWHVTSGKPKEPAANLSGYLKLNCCSL